MPNFLRIHTMPGSPTLTLSIGSEETSLSASEVLETIAVLGTLRAEMDPPIPDAPSARFPLHTHPTGMRWVIAAKGPGMDAPHLFMRHPGIGWFGMAQNEAEARYLADTIHQLFLPQQPTAT